MNLSDPEYTSIPLSNQPPGKRVKRKSPRRFKDFRKRHPFLVWGSVVMLTLFIVGGISGIIYLIPFSKKADEFNLETMTSLEVGSLALDRNGEKIGRISMQDRLLVKCSQVPQHLIDALIATEDTRFFDHQGFDLRGMGRAAIQNIKARSVRQGASTITQQLARHAFSLEGRTFDRKFTELFLANRIEGAFTKDEILESYMNRIYLGSGFWGMGSAARGYFGKDVSELTVVESATLCALIKSPNRYSPFRDPEASVSARNRTLTRMAELKMISADEFSQFSAEPNIALGDPAQAERPHFLLTRIREEALSVLPKRIPLDGLIIETTVDLQIQAQSMKIVDDTLKLIESRENWNHPRPSSPNDNQFSATAKGSPFLQAAVVAIENRSGKIITAVGGRNFKESQYNRAWQSKRQLGSAFLPFLYAVAYEDEKISPTTTLLDAPMDNHRVMIGGESGLLGEWSTESTEEKFEGNISAAYALAKSKNSPAVRMALEKLSPKSVAKFGIQVGLEGNYADYPSIFLGTTPTNLLDAVKAYSAFPNLGGTPSRLELINRITTQNGAVLYETPQVFQTTVFSEDTAEAVHASLSATFTAGTAKPWLPEVSRLKSKVAGKSGTSYGFKDNWFIGYNANYTWGVWLGFDIPTTIYDEAFGSDTALPIWIEIAQLLDTSKPLPLGIKSSVTREVCLQSGCRPGDHCPVVTLPFSTAQKRALFDKEAPLCPIHTSPSETSTLTDAGGGDYTRLRARPISTAVTPTIPVVSGIDPYQSMNPEQLINLE